MKAMPRRVIPMAKAPEATPGRARLTLDLSERLNAAIETYAASHDLTKADVLRTAVEFLLRAERAAQEGMTVGAWKEDPATNRRIERDLAPPSLF
jgi:hypothetical protein